jgi:hypothetical protein
MFNAAAIGDNVTMTLNVANAGTYDVKVSTKVVNSRGIFQLTINGANVGSPVDEYAVGAGAYATFDLGNFNFPAAGAYPFKFTVTGKNPSATAYSLAFDDITLTPQ